MNLDVIDTVPLWVVFVFTTLLLFLSAELAFRLGRRRKAQVPEAEKMTLSTILGATLGMLAFLPAFTFGMAARENSERRHLVLDEANAIRNAYLRASLLPEEQKAEIQDLLRDYVEVRADAVKVKTMEDLNLIITRSIISPALPGPLSVISLLTSICIAHPRV